MRYVFIFFNFRYVLNGACTRKPSLLILAAAFGQLEIVEYLLGQGANPNVCDVSIFWIKLHIN